MSQKQHNGHVITNGIADNDKAVNNSCNSKDGCWDSVNLNHLSPSHATSPPSSALSRLNSLDCWDYTIELECLQGPQGLFSFKFVTFTFLKFYKKKNKMMQVGR